MKSISTNDAPSAIGPYSQAIEVEGLIFVSGQLPVVAETGEFINNNISEQTRQSLQNIKSIVEAAGSTMAKVVKTTVLIKNMDDFSIMNEVYAEFFTAPYPARACYEVSRLPKDALIEIEAIVKK